MKLIKMILALGLVLALTGCEGKADKSSYKYLSDLKAVDVDMSGYSGFTVANHVYKKLTFKESMRFYDEKATGIVYYGYSTCPYCVQIVPVLNDVAKKYDLTVYYVDVHGEDKINDADIDRYLEVFADHLEKDEEGNAAFYVPQVFVFVNGEIVGSHLGATADYDPNMGPMTKNQVKEMTKIFDDMLKPLK